MAARLAPRLALLPSPTSCTPSLWAGMTTLVPGWPCWVSTKHEGLMPPLALPELCLVSNTLCSHASGSTHPHPDPMDGVCIELGCLVPCSTWLHCGHCPEEPIPRNMAATTRQRHGHEPRKGYERFSQNH